MNYQIPPSILHPSTLHLPRLPQYNLNHLIPHFIRLGEPRFKVLLNLLKLLPIAIKVAQIDARAPVAGCKGEFEVVSAERVVGDGRVDGFVKERGRAEEVFGYAEPHAGGLCGN
jgi:hypothetical protein